MPRGEMQEVRKCGNSVSSDVANLSLVDECLVPDICGALVLVGGGILLVLDLAVLCILLLLLLQRNAGNVESCLDELIPRGASLPPL